MDTSTTMAFLIALILVIIINEIEEGIPLIIIGFFTMAFSWNLTSVFGFTSTDLAGWGKVMILGYWITATFAFLKAAATGYYNGVFNARRSKT